MSNKLMASCQACPVVFTAKHRQQIREMLDDHVRTHFELLDEVKQLRAQVEACECQKVDSDG